MYKFILCDTDVYLRLRSGHMTHEMGMAHVQEDDGPCASIGSGPVESCISHRSVVRVSDCTLQRE